MNDPRRSDAVREAAGLREVMSIRETSAYLGVSTDTLYKYVAEQRLPAFKLGNRWKFKKSLLDQWMSEKSAASQPQERKKAVRSAR